MRYVASDLHAEYGLFLKLLERIGFSDSDELYVCGDVIEKGALSVTLAKKLFSMPNVHITMGNHEYQFLKYYNSLMQASGGDCDSVLPRLKEYFPNDGELLDWDTVDAIEALPLYIETEDFICVHAGLPLLPDGRIPPLSTAAPEEMLYNRRFKDPDLIPVTDKCIFYGHTATTAIAPRPEIIGYRRAGRRGNSIKDFVKIHLDLGSFTSGVLGCFSVEECKCYYVKKG